MILIWGMSGVYIYAPIAGIFFLNCAYYLIKNDNPIVRHWIVCGLLISALGALVCELVSHVLYPLPPFVTTNRVCFGVDWYYCGADGVFAGVSPLLRKELIKKIYFRRYILLREIRII